MTPYVHQLFSSADVPVPAHVMPLLPWLLGAVVFFSDEIRDHRSDQESPLGNQLVMARAISAPQTNPDKLGHSRGGFSLGINPDPSSLAFTTVVHC